MVAVVGMRGRSTLVRDLGPRLLVLVSTCRRDLAVALSTLTFLRQRHTIPITRHLKLQMVSQPLVVNECRCDVQHSKCPD